MGKVIHQIEDCIGCGNCVVIAPDHFEMGEQGKAHLKNSEQEQGDEVKETEITEELKQAADSCPVQAIELEQ
ncbi:hypothetical protein AKJ56_00085 [candidate division MSBL1 archaeon SCGC-AAA382N08]|uniref:Ferredoxin n=1 Tax=candidate division MSBL1 archaeon SCGC-AAA382N08 TaxID=1698285 RepID=A0A133VR08_9EURY|nr:hypothetical protein AKJ56_00085 [candidate division MSBL1 archaeon SCGC-AAA382N08]